MQHPVESIIAKKRRTLFVLLFVLTVVVMAVLNNVGATLNTGATPLGICLHQVSEVKDLPQGQADQRTLVSVAQMIDRM